MLAVHATGATTNSDSGVTDLAKVAPAMEVGNITVSTRASCARVVEVFTFMSSKCELAVAVIKY